jgi:hypothetical protein
MISLLLSHFAPILIGAIFTLIGALVRKWEKGNLNEKQQQQLNTILDAVNASGAPLEVKNKIVDLINSKK